MSSERPVLPTHSQLVNSTTWCGPLHSIVTLRDLKNKDGGRSWIRSRRISLGCFERRPVDRAAEQPMSTPIGSIKPRSTHDLVQQPICPTVILPDGCRFQRSKSTHVTHVGAGGLLRKLRRRASEKSRCNTPSDVSPQRADARGRSSSTPKFSGSQAMSRSCHLQLGDGIACQKPVWRSASTTVNMVCCEVPGQYERLCTDSSCLQIEPELDNLISHRSSPSCHYQIFRSPSTATYQTDPTVQTSMPTRPGYHQLMLPAAARSVGQSDCTVDELVPCSSSGDSIPSTFMPAHRPNSYFERSAVYQCHQQSQLLHPGISASVQTPFQQRAIVNGGVTQLSYAVTSNQYEPLTSQAQRHPTPGTCDRRPETRTTDFLLSSEHKPPLWCYQQMLEHQAQLSPAPSFMNSYGCPPEGQPLNTLHNDVRQPESQPTFATPPPNTGIACGKRTPRATTSPVNNGAMLPRPLSHQSLRPDSLLSVFSTTGESSTSDSFQNSSSSRDSAIGGTHVTDDARLKYEDEKGNLLETHRDNIRVSQLDQLLPAPRHPAMSHLPPGVARPRARMYPLPLPTNLQEQPRLPPTPRRQVWLADAPEPVQSVPTDPPAMSASRRIRAERRQHAIYVNADVPPPSHHQHHVSACPAVGSHGAQQNPQLTATTTTATPWTHLLPYRTSTVPQNLSERLKKSETLPNDIWDQVKQSQTVFSCASSYSRPSHQCPEAATVTEPASSQLNTNRSVRQASQGPKTYTARPKSSPPRPPVRSTSQVESNPLSLGALDSELSELSLCQTANGSTQVEQRCPNPGSTASHQSEFTQVEESPVLCRYSQLYSLGTAHFPSYSSKSGHAMIEHPDGNLRKFALMHGRPQC